ncbi:hypothetical protein HDU67_009285 [Dinochytrium kinnereticum]|nr:hypothetical protein HDU67_009285 [Dinochytrium kinnereticum]
MKPHLIWLLYGLHITENRIRPASSWEWDGRDFSLCACEYCPKFIRKFEQYFYYPLMNPMSLSEGVPTYATKSHAALFRKYEIAFLRVVIDGNGKIRPATPVLPQFIMNMTNKAPAKENSWLWPVRITDRKSVIDETAIRLQLKQASTRRITSGTEASSSGEANTNPTDSDFEPRMILYSVILLGGISDDEGESLKFSDIHTGSLIPYLAAPLNEYETPFPDSLSRPILESLTKCRETALKVVRNRGFEWQKLSPHAVMFGSEFIRVGDVLRLTSKSVDGKPMAMLVKQFVFQEDSFDIVGIQWVQSNCFSITVPSTHTRLAAWLPVQDLMPLKTAKVNMKEVAGRLYPVNHMGLKAPGYLAAVIWQDWEKVNGRQMKVKRTTKRPIKDIVRVDDSDIIRKNASLIKGTPRHSIEWQSKRTMKRSRVAHTDDDSDDDDDERVRKKKRTSKRLRVDDSDDDGDGHDGDDEPIKKNIVLKIPQRDKSIVNSPSVKQETEKRAEKEDQTTKSCLTKESVKVHGPPFICTIEDCGRSYGTANELSAHVKSKWLFCKESGCEFTAHRRSTLSGHFRKEHVLPFVKLESGGSSASAVLAPDKISATDLSVSVTPEEGPSFRSSPGLSSNVLGEEESTSAGLGADLLFGDDLDDHRVGSHDDDDNDFDDREVSIDISEPSPVISAITESDPSATIPKVDPPQIVGLPDSLHLRLGNTFTNCGGVASFVSWADRNPKTVYEEFYQLPQFSISEIW